MKQIEFLVLAYVAAAVPTLAAQREFTVELFSNREIKTLTLQAGPQTLNICGAKINGPCLVLRPAEKASCFTARLVHCRTAKAERSFKRLIISSPSPFRLGPFSANANESTRAFLAGNAGVSSESRGLRVTTRVDLESYVAGVLDGEASVLKSPAAREAMAVLARTWAERWQGRHRAQGFDFCTLTHCLAYRLTPAGEAKAAMSFAPAVFATRGQVLNYRGALADPYFSACCGGMTEAAGNVWPDRVQPYLVPIHDPYCLASTHAVWEKAITAASVEQVLREGLHLSIAAPLTELSVERRDSSGRAAVLRIVAGGEWNIDANEFRYAVDRRLGWGQIKSNLYTIQPRGNSWNLRGHGLGHGVGLCQAGAERMGELGYSARQILSTYFPGTEISSPPADDPDPVASSEHFELFYPGSQKQWVKQTLDVLEQWRKELGMHAGALPPRTHVQTWAATDDFIRATGRPGWTAAASDGRSIELQPLALLARKGILNQTLRHELTHLVVHRLCARGVPRWFEEGMVLYATGERIEGNTTAPQTEPELERAITKPRSEAEMRAAYAQALARVRRLAQQRGEPELWRMLEHPSQNDLCPRETGAQGKH